MRDLAHAFFGIGIEALIVAVFAPKPHDLVIPGCCIVGVAAVLYFASGR